MRTLLIFYVSMSVFLASCKKDVTAADPTPAVADPRDVYSGNYNFTVYRTQWNIMMTGGPVTDTSTYAGTIFNDPNSTDKIVIAYGAYQLDTVIVAPDAAGNFWIQTYNLYPGTIDISGNVSFAYRASQSPSHYNDRNVSGVRY